MASATRAKPYQGVILGRPSGKTLTMQFRFRSIKASYAAKIRGGGFHVGDANVTLRVGTKKVVLPIARFHLGLNVREDSIPRAHTYGLDVATAKLVTSALAKGIPVKAIVKIRQAVDLDSRHKKIDGAIHFTKWVQIH